MRIVIELGDEVSTEAEGRIREAVAATSLHDISFQGDELVVERGDFTSITEGDGHRDAQRLMSFVVELTHSGPFGADPQGRKLVPIACGGFVEIATRKRDETYKERKARERADKRANGLRPMEVWVFEEDKPAIRALEAELVGAKLGGKA